MVAVSSDGDKIPIVCVVLQGGQDTIKTVHSSIMAGTPVVIFEVSRTYSLQAHNVNRNHNISSVAIHTLANKFLETWMLSFSNFECFPE